MTIDELISVVQEFWGADHVIPCDGSTPPKNTISIEGIREQHAAIINACGVIFYGVNVNYGPLSGSKFLIRNVIVEK